jgi:hypothetical protein
LSRCSCAAPRHHERHCRPIHILMPSVSACRLTHPRRRSGLPLVSFNALLFPSSHFTTVPPALVSSHDSGGGERRVGRLRTGGAGTECQFVAGAGQFRTGENPRFHPNPRESGRIRVVSRDEAPFASAIRARSVPPVVRRDERDVRRDGFSREPGRVFSSGGTGRTRQAGRGSAALSREAGRASSSGETGDSPGNRIPRHG